MVYRIVLTERAKSDLQAILDDTRDDYTPARQLAYVRDIRRLCEALNPWPKRTTPMLINGRDYRRIIHKAHTVFYRVLDEDSTIIIDAVLHSRMDFEKKL